MALLSDDQLASVGELPWAATYTPGDRAQTLSHFYNTYLRDQFGGLEVRAATPNEVALRPYGAGTFWMSDRDAGARRGEHALLINDARLPGDSFAGGVGMLAVALGVPPAEAVDMAERVHEQLTQWERVFGPGTDGAPARPNVDEIMTPPPGVDEFGFEL
jgi:hypothetical protein